MADSVEPKLDVLSNEDTDIESFIKGKNKSKPKTTRLYDKYGIVNNYRLEIHVNNTTRMSDYITDLALSSHLQVPIELTEVLNGSNDVITYTGPDNIPLNVVPYFRYTENQLEDFKKQHLHNTVMLGNGAYLTKSGGYSSFNEMIRDNERRNSQYNAIFYDTKRGERIDMNSLLIEKNEIVVRKVLIIPDYAAVALANYPNIQKTLELLPSEELKEIVNKIRQEAQNSRFVNNFPTMPNSARKNYFIAIDYIFDIEEIRPRNSFKQFYFAPSDLLFSIQWNDTLEHPLNRKLILRERYSHIFSDFSGSAFIIELVDNEKKYDKRFLRVGFESDSKKAIVHEINPVMDMSRETGYYVVNGFSKDGTPLDLDPVYMTVEDGDRIFDIYHSYEAAERQGLEKESIQYEIEKNKLETARIDAENRIKEAVFKKEEAEQKLVLEREKFKHDISKLQQQIKLLEDNFDYENKILQQKSTYEEKSHENKMTKEITALISTVVVAGLGLAAIIIKSGQSKN